jgi:dihydrofolate reductase
MRKVTRSAKPSARRPSLSPPARPTASSTGKTAGHSATISSPSCAISNGRDLLIQGSSDLIQTLVANDLIDQYRLLVFPVLLGKGKKLFGHGAAPAGLKLSKSAISSTGVIMVTYERAGEVTTGDFGFAEPSAAELKRRRTLE